MAQVHRYRNTVALYTSGPTVYMTQKDAETFARAILGVVTEIATTPFIESTIGTVNVPTYSHSELNKIAE